MPEMARLSYRILIPRAAPLIGSIRSQKSGLDTPRYAPSPSPICRRICVRPGRRCRPSVDRHCSFYRQRQRRVVCRGRYDPHSLESNTGRTPTALVKGLPVIKQSGRPFNFILARVRPNLRNNDAATMALDALGPRLPACMHERVIYAVAPHCKTAFEIEPKGIAAQELSAIWNSLKKKNQEKENSRKQETMQERVNA